MIVTSLLYQNNSLIIYYRLYMCLKLNETGTFYYDNVLFLM